MPLWDFWVKSAAKFGIPAAFAAYLLYFLVNTLSAQLIVVQQALAEHQQQMLINNQVQQIYLYQMCLAMNITAGRPATVCPAPPITPSHGQ